MNEWPQGGASENLLKAHRDFDPTSEEPDPTRNKMKRQPTEWQKIFANNVTDKGLTFKTYKQLIQHSIKKQTAQKMGRRPKQFSKDIQMASRCMTRCSTSLIIREINQNCNEVPPHTSQNGNH